MLNNINNINNSTSFQANFKVMLPVENTKKLVNVQRIFSEKTANLKDTLSLSITDNNERREIFYLGKKQDALINASCVTTFNEMMENLSETEIADKMVKALKVLKEIGKRELLLLGKDIEKYRLNHEHKRHLLIASNCRKEGDLIMAQRFEFLASRFASKLKKIEALEYNSNKALVKNIHTIADGDNDILDFENSI